MKTTLLASTAIALVLTAGAAFAGPTATVIDSGTSNENIIDQSAPGQSSGTTATIEQLSGTNGVNPGTNAHIIQSGSATSTSYVKQHTGVNHFALIIQADGTAGNVSTALIDQAGTADAAVSTQTGDGNISDIRQGVGFPVRTIVGLTNNGTASTAQTGNFNSANIQDISGNTNTATIVQAGDSNIGVASQDKVTSNVIAVLQTGIGNVATSAQYAPTNSLGVQTSSITQDGGETAFVSQTTLGGGNASVVDQQGVGTGNNATVVQLALSGLNVSNVYQTGSLANATVVQVGSNMLSNVNQGGVSNTAFVTQSINNGAVSSVTQLGTLGTATVTQ
jgi:hypothetical protein